MAHRLRSVCASCGAPYTRDATASARCHECQPADRAEDTDRPIKLRRLDDRGTRQARGYGAEWDRLSARARRKQPWCTDCGSPDDLTADHSPEAWRRHERGERIRLRDIDVVCRGCNAARGAARGPHARDRHTVGHTFVALDYARRLVSQLSALNGNESHQAVDAAADDDQGGEGYADPPGPAVAGEISD